MADFRDGSCGYRGAVQVDTPPFPPPPRVITQDESNCGSPRRQHRPRHLEVLRVAVRHAGRRRAFGPPAVVPGVPDHGLRLPVVQPDREDVRGWLHVFCLLSSVFCLLSPVPRYSPYRGSAAVSGVCVWVEQRGIQPGQSLKYSQLPRFNEGL